MISILFLKEAIYCNIFRYNYLWNKKVFVNFLLHFLNLDSIFKFFKKKMTLIADISLNLRTPKNVLRDQFSTFSKKRWPSDLMYFSTDRLRTTLLDKCLKSFVLEDPSKRKHGKRAETLLKSEQQHLYHIYWSLWSRFRLKKSLWVICRTLGLFVNPLTTDNKYSLLIRDNL